MLFLTVGGIIVFVALSVTFTVSGGATTPNGQHITITSDRGFGVSSNSDATEITTGEFSVRFDDASIWVNGNEAASKSEIVKDCQLKVDRGGLTIISDGKTIVQVD